MRIISQDGMIDIPYEQVVIQAYKKQIYFCNANFTGVEEFVNDIVIAEYSTQEKAMKAMEMLREKYLSRMELDGGYDITSGHYVQPNFWVLPRVFQFPKDEEVEV